MALKILSKIVNTAQKVVSNPIVSKVASIAAPGAFAAVKSAVNGAAGILKPPAPKAAPPAKAITAKPVSAPAKVPTALKSSPAKGLGDVVSKLAPNYVANTGRILRAFKRA